MIEVIILDSLPLSHNTIFTGYFCPNGTIADDQYPCPSGTYSNRTDLASADECDACPLGYYCR